MITSRREAGLERQQSLVDVRDATRRYDGGTTALDGVSLSIRRGEAVAVLGPSGCGKSTLLNLLAGLDRPSSGSVTVAGNRVDRLGETRSARYRRRHIGMVFQFFNLLDDLTAADNVMLPAQLSGGDRAAARDRAAALLARLGIGHRADRYPSRLSGGERQRVAIARALINDPALLLADEPTGALDSVSGQQVAEVLREINAAGQTVVLVTHDRSLARSVAHRTIQMRDGQIVSDAGVTP